MKQLLIILSLTIATFIVACGDGTKKTPLSKSKGGDSAKIAEKASSDEELLNLKKLLETKNAQVPEIINTVKKKFSRISSKKTQPVKKDKDGKIIEKTKDEEDQAEDKIKNQIAEFAGKELMPNSKLDAVNLSGYKNVKVKGICIKTCDVQVLVENEIGKDNEVLSTNAFVVVRINKENLEVDENTQSKKTFDSLTASYAATTNATKLVLKMNDSKESILKIENYSYSESDLPSLKFTVKRSGKIVDRGTLDIYKDKDEDVKTLNLKFEISADSVLLFVTQDYGLFGSNKTVVKTEEPSGDKTAL